MAGPQTLNGKVVLKVFLLDNSMKTLLVEPTSTVHDACLQMAEKLGVSDPEDDSLCLSLNECLDGVTIGRALPSDKEVLGIMESWYGNEDAKFICQVKLYTDGMINTKDSKLLNLLFIQGVYHVIAGHYPTTDRDAVALAALQFQARFGNHNPASHKPGFLTSTLIEYMPGFHIENGGKTPQQWEDLIFHKHAFSTSSTPREAYLAMLSKRSYYGAALFVAKQRFEKSFPKRLYIAVGRRGVVLVRMPDSPDDEEGMETLQSYPLADIYRWAYKPGVNFYFEIKGEDGEENAVYTFETGEGKSMSDLLTDYALALLREMGLNPDGSKRVRAAKPAPGKASAGSSAPPPVQPSRAAMASSSDAYREVGGEAGSLTVAALRSGEYVEPAAASSKAAAAVPAVAAAFSLPPPPPPPPPSSGGGLPANWIECTDESTGDVYYFNQVSGESVWDRADVK